MKNVKGAVFWPPFLLLIAAMALCLYDLKTFQAAVNAANGWLPLARPSIMAGLNQSVMMALAILREGELVQVGTPEDIIHRPADEYVRKFVNKRSQDEASKLEHRRILEKPDARSYRREEGLA